MKKIIKLTAILTAISMKTLAQAQSPSTNDYMKQSSAASYVYTSNKCYSDTSGAILDALSYQLNLINAQEINTQSCKKAIDLFFEKFPEAPADLEFKVARFNDYGGSKAAHQLPDGTSCVKKNYYIGYVETKCTVMPVQPEPQIQDQMLNGKIFCRTVETGGFFGQPKGKSEHCVKFEDNIMTDNANTFFGNPPSRIQYQVINDKIIDMTTNQETGYVLQGDHIVRTESGLVLEKK